MICIGLNVKEKQKEISRYIEKHGITRVYIFYPAAFPLGYPGAKQVEYREIIMYRTFYPLLGEIDDRCLLVFNECLRTQKRSDLTYNCAHHYCNQTPHKLIFENFPFIEGKEDFMILLDLVDKGRFKGESFNYLYLQTEDVKVKPFRVRVSTIPVEVEERHREQYEKKKEALFANLGEKDPETIPRALQLFAGDLKKKAIDPGELYVARNKRLKLDNVKTYEEIAGKGDYLIVDLHFRRLNFNDFLKGTRMHKVRYLCTTLPVDTAMLGEFSKWTSRLEAFYAQASLYK